MTRDYSYLNDVLAEWSFSLDKNQIEQLDLFYDLIIEKNKVMNLTSITEFNEFLVKHFVDSLSICKILNNNINTVLDLGTGAGFPGIPMAIAYPTLQFTLVDSLNKRIKFLQDVINSLNLTNVILVHARAEDIGHDKNYREKYDLVVSRAVANIATLSEYCLPLVKLNGSFISFKSGDIDMEINNSANAISKLGGLLDEPIFFTLPKTDIRRSFIIINKIKNTSQVYPRKAGTPSKEPLS